VKALSNENILKIFPKPELISFSWLIALGCIILLTGCGDSNKNGITPPDKPCVISEYNPGVNALGKPSPTTFVLDNSSPDYCQNVKADFKAAMTWYRTQVANNSYPPTMEAEYANYYTGQILSDARTGLFYNKQAKRVVIGRFNAETLAITDQTWTKDGTTSTLTVKPDAYSLASFPEGAPEKATVTESGQFENWEVALVYDAGSGHWKIKSAQTIFVFPGG
jgi:hypothetical protein